jgi:hypothetical protein
MILHLSTGHFGGKTFIPSLSMNENLVKVGVMISSSILGQQHPKWEIFRFVEPTVRESKGWLISDRE